MEDRVFLQIYKLVCEDVLFESIQEIISDINMIISVSLVRQILQGKEFLSLEYSCTKDAKRYGTRGYSADDLNNDMLYQSSCVV